MYEMLEKECSVEEAVTAVWYSDVTGEQMWHVLAQELIYEGSAFSYYNIKLLMTCTRVIGKMARRFFGWARCVFATSALWTSCSIHLLGWGWGNLCNVNQQRGKKAQCSTSMLRFKVDGGAGRRRRLRCKQMWIVAPAASAYGCKWNICVHHDLLVL